MVLFCYSPASKLSFPLYLIYIYVYILYSSVSPKSKNLKTIFQLYFVIYYRDIITETPKVRNIRENLIKQIIIPISISPHPLGKV